MTPGESVFAALALGPNFALMEYLERQQGATATREASEPERGSQSPEPPWVPLKDLWSDPAVPYSHNAMLAAARDLRGVRLLEDRPGSGPGTTLDVRYSSAAVWAMQLAGACVREARGFDDYHHHERRTAVAAAFANQRFLAVAVEMAKRGDDGMDLPDIARVFVPGIVLPATSGELSETFGKLHLYERTGSVIRTLGLGESFHIEPRPVRYRLHPSIAERLLQAVRVWGSDDASLSEASHWLASRLRLLAAEWLVGQGGHWRSRALESQVPGLASGASDLAVMHVIRESIGTEETGRVDGHSFWADSALPLGRALTALAPLLEEGARIQEQGLADRRPVFAALAHRGCRWYAWKLIEALGQHRRIDRTALVRELAECGYADEDQIQRAISSAISRGVRGGTFSSTGGGHAHRVAAPGGLAGLLELGATLDIGEPFDAFRLNDAHVLGALGKLEAWRSMRLGAEGGTGANHASTQGPRAARRPPSAGRRPEVDL